jgi:hypothetical protein
MGADVPLTTAVDIFAIGIIGAVLLTGESAPGIQLALARSEIEGLLLSCGLSGSLARALRLTLAVRAEQRPNASQLLAYFSRGAEWWHESFAPVATAAAPAAVIPQPSPPAPPAAAASGTAASDAASVRIRYFPLVRL